MGNAVHYVCSRCGEVIGLEETQYVCPHDGGNLDVQIDIDRIQVEFSPAAISASDVTSIWRYLPLLPVDHPGHEGTPIWSVGWTPMFRPAPIASSLGLENLWIKDDGRNPTASFKDRASAVVVARAQQIGADTIVTASTGNAGAALAGMAAAASQPAVIMAPKNAPPAKVAQLLIFGAKVILVEGTYDDAFDLTLEAAESFGWYCRNTGYNPFTAEGKKTAAFEICEQLSKELDPKGGNQGWLAPDAVFVSVGDGNIISGLHKGFKDLKALGWIERVPRLYGIQSTGSAAIYNAFSAGTEEIKAVSADTIADSISVDLPRDGLRALRAATQTDGAFLAVSDEAILEAIAALGQVAIFAEPAGATAYAGLVAALEKELIDPSEQIVVLNTGSGLKDIDAARKAAGETIVIKPTLKALQQVLK
jgi:threonine synthase